MCTDAVTDSDVDGGGSFVKMTPTRRDDPHREFTEGAFPRCSPRPVLFETVPSIHPQPGHPVDENVGYLTVRDEPREGTKRIRLAPSEFPSLAAGVLPARNRHEIDRGRTLRSWPNDESLASSCPHARTGFGIHGGKIRTPPDVHVDISVAPVQNLSSTVNRRATTSEAKTINERWESISPA